MPARSPSAGQVTAYEGARLIVGDGTVVKNGTIVVDGARIVAAGANVSVPAGATRVNLAGKTVMPMIIDTHVHLSPTRERIIVDLKRRAYYGVSAAMSMGADLYEMLPIRGENIPGAAKFLSAGRGITMPEPGRMTAPYWIQTEAEAVKAVQELADRKVDIVKIWVDDWRGKYKKLTPEIYGAIIKEAHEERAPRHRAHLRAGGCQGPDARRSRRLRARRARQGHRRRIRRDVEAAPEPGADPEPAGPRREDGPELAKAGMPAEELEKLEKANVDNPPTNAFFSIQARNLAKLNAAGVRIAMGTDGNRPWGAHVEMEDMVAAGMTPAQVIVAATRNGAEFLRLNDQGTLAAGKSADFIVLDANPLDDITNTRKISSVVLRGAAVDRSKPVQ